MNEYFQSASKTKQSNMRKPPEVGPRTHVEPATNSRRQLTDNVDVQIEMFN